MVLFAIEEWIIQLAIFIVIAGMGVINSLTKEKKEPERGRRRPPRQRRPDRAGMGRDNVDDFLEQVLGPAGQQQQQEQRPQQQRPQSRPVTAPSRPRPPLTQRRPESRTRPPERTPPRPVSKTPSALDAGAGFNRAVDQQIAQAGKLKPRGPAATAGPRMPTALITLVGKSREDLRRAIMIAEILRPPLSRR